MKNVLFFLACLLIFSTNCYSQKKKLKDIFKDSQNESQYEYIPYNGIMVQRGEVAKLKEQKRRDSIAWLGMTAKEKDQATGMSALERASFSGNLNDMLKEQKILDSIHEAEDKVIRAEYVISQINARLVDSLEQLRSKKASDSVFAEMDRRDSVYQANTLRQEALEGASYKIAQERNESVLKSMRGKLNSSIDCFKVENVPMNLIYRFDTASEGAVLASNLGEEPKIEYKFNFKRVGDLLMINQTYQGVSSTDYWIVYDKSTIVSADGSIKLKRF